MAMTKTPAHSGHASEESGRGQPWRAPELTILGTMDGTKGGALSITFDDTNYYIASGP